MTPETHDSQTADEKFDDEHDLAHTMGGAAEMLGTTRRSCAASAERG